MFTWLKRFFGQGTEQDLTREMVDTLQSEKLFFKVLDTLSDSEYVNEAQHDFVYMTVLDGEVNNGGFNQYYYNSGEDRHNAKQAFARMGAAELAELVRQANACYEANRARLEKHWDGTIKGFTESYDEKLFDEFDSRYNALLKKNSFYDLMAQFVRSRAGEFVTKK